MTEVRCRSASVSDCAALAQWNHQLIRDEGHRNPMTVPELEQRMRGWLTDDGYTALIFEQTGEPVAYALFRDDESRIHLRQLFVVRHRRREGIGRSVMGILMSKHWSSEKRLTVDVLVENPAAVAFWQAIGYKDYALTLEITPVNSDD